MAGLRCHKCQIFVLLTVTVWLIIALSMLYSPIRDINVESISVQSNGNQKNKRVLITNSTPITIELSKYIPKTIHVASKYAPNASNKEQCIAMNAEYNFIVYNDDQVFNDLTNRFGAKLLSRMRLIEKIDLWRYYIMQRYGGVYLDGDAECRQPISKWMELYFNDTMLFKDLPIHPQQIQYFKRHLEHNRNSEYILPIDMIIAQENEKDYNLQIVQWSFVSRTNNPILSYIINYVLNQLYVTMPFKNVSEIHDKDIGYRTGPEAFSKSIFSYITTHSRELGYPNILFSESKLDVNGQLLYLFDNQQNITLLFLPFRAFKHPHGYDESKQNLIFHGFKGSWKNRLKKNKGPFDSEDNLVRKPPKYLLQRKYVPKSQRGQAL